MSMFHELMMRKKEEIMYATIKGTLTESPEGVFSGFSDGNYLRINNINNFALADNWEIFLKINSGGYLFGTNKRYGITFTKNKLYLSSNGTSWDIASGVGSGSAPDNCYVRLKFTGTQYIFDYSTDKITWINSVTVNSSTKITNTINSLILGYWYTNYYASGSIDLPNSYIKLGSTKYNLQAVVGYTIVGSPTIVDGVVSGFSSSDYLTLPSYSGTIQSLEFVVKVNTIPTTITNNALILQLTGVPINIYVRTNLQITMSYKDETDTTRYLNSGVQIEAIYYKFVLNSTGAYIYSSSNGISWELLNSYSYTTTILINGGKIGYATSTYNVYDGSLDIGKSFSKINNKLWFNGQPS